MEKMNNVFKASTMDYFKTGEYKISFEDFIALKKQNKAMMLDLRTKEEAELISFSFALNIPIEDLPERLNELPKDKLIVTFCASSVRAIMAFPYLKAAGYDNVKMFVGKISDLTVYFMPPFVAANYEALKEA